MDLIKNVFNYSFLLILFFGSFCFTLHAEPNFYPSAEQAPEEIEDEADCRSLAIELTGIDPIEVQQYPGYSTAPRKGGALEGAAGGAMAGAVGGAIVGEARDGAAIGAGVGAVGGTMHQRAVDDAYKRSQIQVERQRQALLEKYNRAFKSCMEEKGYSFRQ